MVTVKAPRSSYRYYDEVDDISSEWLAEVLINGNWLEYAICDKVRNLQTTFPLGEYLGSSTEVHIEGVRQEFWDEVYHFWAAKTQGVRPIGKS